MRGRLIGVAGALAVALSIAGGGGAHGVSTHPNGPIVVGFASGGGSIAIPPSGGAERPFLAGGFVGGSFSSDGTRFAYSRALNLIVAAGNGSNDRSVELGPYDNRAAQPSLSPDGRKLAFVSSAREGDPAHIYTVNADGSELRQLTSAVQADGFPAWSPRGDLIAFTRYFTNGYELYVTSPTGGARPLTFGIPNTFSHDAAWSPDGTMLAFREDTAHGTHIAIVGPDGDGHRVVTGDSLYSAGYANPAWSPDGAKIAFVEDETRVRTIDVAGTNLTTIYSSGADHPILFLAWQAGEVGLATVAQTGSGQIVPRHALSVHYSVDSTSGGAANDVRSSVRVTGGRIVKLSAGRGACTWSTGVCRLGTLEGDATTPIEATVVPTGTRLTVKNTVTATNETTDASDDAATISVAISPCTIMGTPFDDTLHASKRGGDRICGLAGDDVIDARNGKRDTVDGGPGRDTARVDRVDRVVHAERVIRLLR